MKRIVEIRRGEAVPSSAKWIKDVVRIVRTWTEDNHPQLPPEELHELATFDVFEVEDYQCSP